MYTTQLQLLQSQLLRYLQPLQQGSLSIAFVSAIFELALILINLNNLKFEAYVDGINVAILNVQ